MKKLNLKKTALALAAATLLVGGCAKQDNTLRMITEATFPPYEYLKGHEVVGIDVEICKAVAQKLGRPFKCESVDFDSVIPAVISGKADVAAAGITITEDRKKNVDFSVPYVKTGIVVIYKKSNPFAKPEQLKGKKIGVQSGTTSETYVLEQLGQEPERSRSPAEAVAALKTGRVDFVIADVDPAKNCVKGESDLAVSDFITSEEYAVAIRKGQPELLKAINDTIAEVKANGQLAKWIADFTAESDKLKDK
jgi:ABC-type amino acid transport substrate-binding protein